MTNSSTMRVKSLTQTALAAALIAVCAWITIPAAVSFTMQTFAVFTAVGLLGAKRGTLSVVLYIMLGALGLPVFSGFRGGARRSCGKYGRLHCRIRFCGAYQRPFDQPVRPYDPRALFLHDRGTDCLLRVRQRMVLYPLYQKHRQHRHTLDPFSMRISVYPVRSCKNRISNIPCPAPEAYRRRMALMTTKETVLFMLEKSRGVPLSGAKMAKRAGVSRTAIWKAIEELRRDGYDISAAKREGYTLAANSDVLSEPRLRSYVQTQGLTFTLYKSIESTNACAKQLALSGAPEGAVVLSEMQTAGRGRGGKSFYSPAGTGLYMSILLRPEISAAGTRFRSPPAPRWPVAQAAEAAAKRPAQIKWVNDVYMSGKKICGILTEGAFDLESGGLEYAVARASASI